ncbi:MAG: DUF2318 domain-containing protein [Oscillospiraceae bacterium]|jgi:uncharacterized membrane protein|nr:DUF2318 domain-containing protein [Oscillospiraceae bacterium]
MKKKTAILTALVALLALVLTACGDNANSKTTQPAQVIAAGESLTIPTASVSDTATFYPITVEGTRMEVLAVKAPDGTIRTAFNTCQVCYSSGQGYYKQVGSVLQCQNCKNQFPMSAVEVESGGCNPYPIFAKDKTVTDDSIRIDYDFLLQAKAIFANWKKF